MDIHIYVSIFWSQKTEAQISVCEPQVWTWYYLVSVRSSVSDLQTTELEVSP